MLLPAAQAKWENDKFYKVYFFKGVDDSKKIVFRYHQDVSFRVPYFTCKDASDPFQRTVIGSVSDHEVNHEKYVGSLNR